MDEDQLDLVHELKEELSEAITEMVNAKLARYAGEVEDLVRLQLGEQFRFWKN